MQETLTIIIIAIAALVAARHLYRSFTAPSCNCHSCKKKGSGKSCCQKEQD